MPKTWQCFDLSFEATETYANPYTDVTLDVDFTSPTGKIFTRPAFWQGGSKFIVRFAAPTAGQWSWSATHADAGLNGSGEFEVEETISTNRYFKHGFLKMSPKVRSLVHADGTPFVIAGDTAWGLPWRGTEEAVAIYAKKRQSQGFNAVLLMTVQPDMDARGPSDRTQDEGFGVGFLVDTGVGDGVGP
jgi:hypothetical protein